MQRTPKQGRKLRLSGKNGVNKHRHNNDTASTPLGHRSVDSPPCEGDQSPLCASPGHSPIPFFCTQDGSHGENDVVWNYYSPSSDKGSPTRPPSETPNRKRSRRFYYKDYSPVTRIPNKKKIIRSSLKKSEYIKGLKEELAALNRNVAGLLSSKPSTESSSSPVRNEANNVPFREQSPELDDYLFENPDAPVKDLDSMFNDISHNIPSKCNVNKQNIDLAVELDDSMNDLLFKASQIMEENVSNNIQDVKIQLSELKVKCLVNAVNSPKLTNDSFDNIIGNLNDSEIEFLSQKPQTSTGQNKNVRNEPFCMFKKQESLTKKKLHSGITTRSSTRMSNSNWNDGEADLFLDSIPDVTNLLNNSALNESKTKFIRHNSMPESPGRQPEKKFKENNSSTKFIRHISMPVTATEPDPAFSGGLSQGNKCTPEDIKRKHQAAKERLLAKKNELISGKPCQQIALHHSKSDNNLIAQSGNGRFVYKSNPVNSIKIPSVLEKPNENVQNVIIAPQRNKNNNQIIDTNQSKGSTRVKVVNIQEEIERKRKEALERLQRKRNMAGARK